MATIDLGQGVWRFHQIYGVVPHDKIPGYPEVDGTSTHVVLTFTKRSEALEATKEGLTLVGEWFEGVIATTENPLNTAKVWGAFRVKVFPAVPEIPAAKQMIEVYHTEYIRDKNQHYTNQVTIYSGLLIPPADPARPVFVGYGADNSGRGWMSFVLAPDSLHL